MTMLGLADEPHGNNEPSVYNLMSHLRECGYTYRSMQSWLYCERVVVILGVCTLRHESWPDKTRALHGRALAMGTMVK